MKIVKKVALVFFVVVFLLTGVALFFWRNIATRAVPDYNATLTLSGISEEVTVFRGAYGVPHIYAQNEADLYRAVGYVMAQDRMWQMDLMRRVCDGRLSEILGKKFIDTDLLMRSLRMSEKSRMVVEHTDKKLIELARAFADGVNQYIENHKNKLPPEFTILGYSPDKWEIIHSVNLVGYMAWDLNTAWGSEVLLDKMRAKFGEEMVVDLVYDYPKEKSLIYPDFKLELAKLDIKNNFLRHGRLLNEMGLFVFSGSNNWAVSGKKSVTGKPLLANDMHLGLNAPGIWYQMHQVVEEKLNVTGVLLPGQPMIVAGHNDHIAWGFTNVMVDGMDFYLEKVNPDNPNQYEFNGEWRNMEVREETINIKDSEPIKKKLRFTHRGPIISEFKGMDNKAVSMRWIGNEYSNELRTLHLFSKARNWEDFKNAASTFAATSQNIVYADVEGNIGLYCSAGVHIRDAGNAISISPGWTDEYDWKGQVPFEKLPHSYNPERGFVSSANNKTVDNDYPYYISSWFVQSHRIDRIREMLEEKDKLSIDDFKRMHADHKSKLVEEIREDIIDEVKNSDNLTALEKQSLEIFTSWDGVLTRESPATSIFETFYGEFIKNVFADEMGDELFEEYISGGIRKTYAIQNLFRNKKSPWFDNVNTVEIKETFTHMVRKSFKDAVNILSGQLGANPVEWQWGKIHKLTLSHPMGSVKILDRLFKFNRGPFEVGGSFHTVCPYTYSFKKPFAVTHGASQRHIYDTSNWDRSLVVIPTGVSGIPAGDHYCDQTELYVNNKYHSDYFSRELVEKNAKYKMIINGN